MSLTLQRKRVDILEADVFALAAGHVDKTLFVLKVEAFVEVDDGVDLQRHVGDDFFEPSEIQHPFHHLFGFVFVAGSHLPRPEIDVARVDDGGVLKPVWQGELERTVALHLVQQEIHAVLMKGLLVDVGNNGFEIRAVKLLGMRVREVERRHLPDIDETADLHFAFETERLEKRDEGGVGMQVNALLFTLERVHDRREKAAAYALPSVRLLDHEILDLGGVLKLDGHHRADDLAVVVGAVAQVRRMHQHQFEVIAVRQPARFVGDGNEGADVGELQPAYEHRRSL